MPLTFNDFSAWIEVDGASLEIYDAKENGKEVTGWIPSETGKEFFIKWKTGARPSEMVGDIHIDGEPYPGRAMPMGGEQTFIVTGAITSNTTEKPFLFSPLELTDDDEYLHKATAGLGDVKLVISHATFGKSVPLNRTYAAVGKVHEKAKKATGHKVGLGIEKTKTTNMVATTRLGVAVTFIFKYRPIEMLRANGIAPPLPIPTNKRAASLAEPDVPDSTQAGPVPDDDHDDDEIASRMRDLQAEMDALQRKRRKTSHVKSEPRVKREPGPSTGRNKGAGRVVSLGVIDLT
ncbi:hypothetical protein BDP27DRAFT_507225 [Rhodocollybia butyracea]|uniref:DUF7918 domain-containing protein n=1 Tax=Rhodocollybia butyracea TaxID=206335 RepID=A0A9P5P8Q8_9AGAR|nr:hypothetical protein BDP27DRAFT_507225 [Rhodocollybia butyracea]